MRKVVSFFTEQKEEEHIAVVREAYYQALLILRSTTEFNTADIKVYCLRDLLLETLNQLVLYFKEHKDRITHDGGQKTVDDLTLQLASKTSAPDVVQTLKANLYHIKPGWVDRGFVYSAFATLLSLPIFQAESLWRSEANRVSTLETNVDRLEKKIDVLSYAEHQTAVVSSQHDYSVLQNAKSILFADSFKVHTKGVEQEDEKSQEEPSMLTRNNTASTPVLQGKKPVPDFNFKVVV